MAFSHLKLFSNYISSFQNDQYTENEVGVSCAVRVSLAYISRYGYDLKES